MIDVMTEKPITLKDARKLDIWPGGKGPHYSTLMRWATAGSKGVKLECVRIGGKVCTTVEAIQRFIERCSAPHLPQAVVSAQQQRQAHERAEAYMIALGM